MKCKKWIKVCMVLVTISVFLMGCGETGDDVQGGDNSKTQYEAKKGETKGLKNSKNSLFKGTIFDYLIFGETTLADIEQLLDDRVLEYKHGYSSTSYLNGKTKITDEFYGSRAIYNYEFTEDPELVDYYTYKIKATQPRYQYLLKKAKEKGL